ncbi:MAG TPA: glycosyltransferase family 9 protein [Chlamydiales bacterium]|nr:MAG: hypothetical protein A3F67_11055 [Verrucomicrobia bacterium RIFCSPHIGHO2_12_FULL_41_10]HLB53122.1 glycosyltransferase family 9 protein [Chlamydiales bacterium]
MDRKKILIVKIGAIGDVVMAMPLLTYFHNERLTWVIGKQAAPLLQGKVETLIVVDEERLFKGTLAQRFIELSQVVLQLAGRKFTLILTIHTDWRYQLISCFTFAKKRKSFCPLPGQYHSSEILRLASGKDHLQVELPQIELTFSKYQDPKAIVLAPGGAKNPLADDALRRWPIQHYVTLAKELEKRGIPIILTGSNSDAWVTPHFDGVTCKNLIGKLSLLELISLLQGIKLLVTHDSGPLHLAKLAKCPTIALFGPTNPLEKIGKKDTIDLLWGGESLPCRPCYNGKTYAPCTRNICLENILPDHVLQKILTK